MTYQWHRQAEDELLRAVAYCATEFDKAIAKDFLDHIDHQIVLLVSSPKLGKREPLLKGRRREYRSLVIHKLFKLIYYINDEKQRIVIADLWDVRREPAKLIRRIRTK